MALGLRWAGFGTNLTFHLAGGEQGMRHMLHQFGPALKLPWTKLVAPELTEDLIDAMVEGAETSGRRSQHRRTRTAPRRLSDRHHAGIAGGRCGSRQDPGQSRSPALWPQAPWSGQKVRNIGTPLELYRCAVEPEWVDYNGHMTEAAYLTAFGWATDALFRYVGNNEEYRSSGTTFFTAETHINYLREAKADDQLRFTTQIVGLDDKRLHFYHEMFNELTGDLVATTEQMDLHVDMNTGRTAPIQGMPAKVLESSGMSTNRCPPPRTSAALWRSLHEYSVLSTQYSVSAAFRRRVMGQPGGEKQESEGSDETSNEPRDCTKY